MTAKTVTSLEYIHKKGYFGNYQKQNVKNLLQISEVKNLTIIQLVQYKKSKNIPIFQNFQMNWINHLKN